MNIFAISDLHLCFSNPTKTMEVFGDKWKDYQEKIKKNWLKTVSINDIVLIAGDISWAKTLEEVAIDLLWVDKLPGTKIMIKGNHDYFWNSKSNLNKILPPSIHIIQNDSFNIDSLSIGGTRLWDSDEYNFDEYIQFKKNPYENKKSFDDSKIFSRELKRLELSLKTINQNAKFKIALLHYPPISADLQDSKTSHLLEKYNVDIAIFGHMHHIKKQCKLFGEKNNIKYILTSSDYLDFTPIKIASI